MRGVQSEVFLDSTYAIALAAASDQYHARAVSLADELQAARTRLVTTQAVLLEIGNALARKRYRAAAVKLLASLDSDPNVHVVQLTSLLHARAFQLFQQMADKEWGLTDCVSFIVMRDRGIGEALTADEHFAQAGFRTLLQVPQN
jgi:predicted nucleic acid-binding protein